MIISIRCSSLVTVLADMLYDFFLRRDVESVRGLSSFSIRFHAHFAMAQVKIVEVQKLF
jgi:hypothetical protein